VTTPILPPPLLTGTLVRLEPLAAAHVTDLEVAAAEDRTTYRFAAVPAPDAVAAMVTQLRAEAAAGTRVPFAQVRIGDGRAIGMTTFLNLRYRESNQRPFAVEIGGTWLAASAQRTGVNVEAKVLLLTHAFDEWAVARVDLKTDARNERSRTAIAALGTSFEGVLRQWQPSQVRGEETLLRDSAMYSLLAADWPVARVGLVARLQR
jgi:RimJ/RimL family protein N-acetyltransferase